MERRVFDPQDFGVWERGQDGTEALERAIDACAEAQAEDRQTCKQCGGQTAYLPHVAATQCSQCGSVVTDVEYLTGNGD